MLTTIWFVFVTIAFFFNTKIQLDKDKIIKNLQDVNANLSNKIEDINAIISNIDGYLLTLNFYDRFNGIDIKKMVNLNKDSIKNSNLSAEEYKKLLPIIDNLNRSVTNMEILIDSRINGLNNILREVSLDKEAREIYNVNYREFESNINESRLFKNSLLIKRGDFSELKDKIKYMNFLERFINSIPFTKPIKNYYISSKFGSRVDPFTKKVKVHQGLDFVGSLGSIVYAPADGTVDVVAKRGGFGNSIEIDHGNNIKTEYAHLQDYLVKVGDKVKRGDKIGIQGSTGRSTGQHLHWEVRIKRQHVDPMKFVRVGEKLF